MQTLATAFNRMTGRLEEQTNALRTANTQLDTRRAFIEAVLSSVTAGVIAVDPALRIRLLNRSAETLLQKGEEDLEGKELASVSAELDEFMRGEQSDANVLIADEGVQRTLAVKRMRYGDGSVLTFDDITDQLSDQRRAAWSDIARRIAHEIKNPLTPIQLAAERLQRRFGKEITSDSETFERLDGHDRPPGWRSQADGRRILQFRAHAQAGLSVTRTFTRSRGSPCSCTRLRIPRLRSCSSRRRNERRDQT